MYPLASCSSRLTADALAQTLPSDGDQSLDKPQLSRRSRSVRVLTARLTALQLRRQLCGQCVSAHCLRGIVEGDHDRNGRPVDLDRCQRVQ